MNKIRILQSHTLIAAPPTLVISLDLALFQPLRKKTILRTLTAASPSQMPERRSSLSSLS